MAANKSDNKNKKKGETGSFTVDADGTREMPSITRLLNRKRLGGTGSSSKTKTAVTVKRATQPLPEPTPLPPPVSPTPDDFPMDSAIGAKEDSDSRSGTLTGLPKPDFSKISMKIERNSPAPSELPPKIQRVERRRVRSAHVTPPLVWSVEQLQNGSDPLGRGLALLIQRGARSALFLSISPPPPGGKLPSFVSTAAALADKQRLATWTGLRWDPSQSPRVWQQILKAGFTELLASHYDQATTMLRTAFGTEASEILLLIRVGPINACRGLLAVVSTQSLLMDVAAVLSLFNVSLQKSAA